jgi:hypothetical protein
MVGTALPVDISCVWFWLWLEQAQTKLEGLRPLNIVVPAGPQNTTEEWNPKMAAQLPIPKYFSLFENGTKCEPGNKYFV